MPVSPFHTLSVQVIFDSDTGIPADRTVNTFHFRNATDIAWTAAALDEVKLALDSFYGTTQTGTSQELDTFMSSRLAGTVTYKMFDLHEAPPRVPVREQAGAVIVPGTTSLPTEVALCLSYQASKISGVPQARRRGRVFIGPLSIDGLVQATGLPNGAANGIVDTVAACGTFLASGSWSAIGSAWTVYSPTSNLQADVVDGWVDLAFDTQRRRGEKAASRQLWT